MKEELLQDMKALGGTPVFFVIACIAYLLGFFTLGTTLVLGYALCLAITILFRLLFFRERPNKVKYSNFFSKLDASSFPSLHAMRAFFFAEVLSSFFQDPFVTIILFFCAISVGIIRVFQKRHHLSDVIVGAIIGFLVGILLNFYIL